MQCRLIAHEGNSITTGSRGGVNHGRSGVSRAEWIWGWWEWIGGNLGNCSRCMMIWVLNLCWARTLRVLGVILPTVCIGYLCCVWALVCHMAWLPASETAPDPGEMLMLLRCQVCILSCSLHLDRGLALRYWGGRCAGRLSSWSEGGHDRSWGQEVECILRGWAMGLVRGP